MGDGPTLYSRLGVTLESYDCSRGRRPWGAGPTTAVAPDYVHAPLPRAKHGHDTSVDESGERCGHGREGDTTFFRWTYSRLVSE